MVEGKSKAIRDVKILNPGSAILYAYLTGWRRGVFDSPWLFPSDKNWQKPYVGRTLRRRMGLIQRALGGGLRVSARVIRHTWTTALADQGVPMHHLAQMAGHEDIQTTYKHYIGLADPKQLGAEVNEVMLYEED
jgi:integrase